MGISSDKLEKWESDPAGMMDYYKHQNYTMGQSIADLIDNSYDANATKIDVKISFDSGTDKPYIVILDNGYVGIGKAVPTESLHVGGDAIIEGNLTVQGGTTFIKTDNLSVKDKIIELAANNTSSTGLESGILINRGMGTGTSADPYDNRAIIWNENNMELETYYFNEYTSKKS